MTTIQQTTKLAATAAMLTIAATIGVVLMLTVIAAITHHSAHAPQPAHTATTRAVPCLTYLSHAAMLDAADANIPAPVSFCASTER